ncbi:MAG: hypothetical protein M8364_17155 [Methylobacter sp.]|uniref:hypothetical protein n=1 Tax=Methylobacter sp. TaxID=2051955 RepID=UPI0025844298|nr:hypothetical protein [Methylobacter sp.]MCL7422620.1 hypothetical protein [Methylobacter sp.]
MTEGDVVGRPITAEPQRIRQQEAENRRPGLDNDTLKNREKAYFCVRKCLTTIVKRQRSIRHDKFQA